MFSGMHKLLCKNFLTRKLIRNNLQRLSLHSSCPFHVIYIDSCKKHIHNVMSPPYSSSSRCTQFCVSNGVRIRFSVFT